MVSLQLRSRGIRDERVLHAMTVVPRHRFVPPAYLEAAYEDTPLPLGEGQTISQPYIVARMTEALDVLDGDRVLEIGTGSGYQTAVLAELGLQVFSMERSPILASHAKERLRSLGYDVRTRVGDGTLGWLDHAPYAGILATGGLPRIPESLVRQLAPRGALVAPIGTLHAQRLLRITYDRGNIRSTELCGCRFVPLVGRYGWPGGDPVGGWEKDGDR